MITVLGALGAGLTEEQLAMNAAFDRRAVRSRAGHGPDTTTPTTVQAWAADLAGMRGGADRLPVHP